MLEVDYSRQLDSHQSSTAWEIELPVEWSNFFAESGEGSAYAGDERTNQRLKIRTNALLWFDSSLPFRPRGSDPVGIYTRDFSRHGAGFLTPFELFPEEKLRIVLPNFWVQLHVVRVRRITSKCYEIGASLIQRHDPSLEAFERQDNVA